MADFGDQIAKWVEEVEGQIDNTLQTIVMQIGRSVVTLSPVDTGRFKGNWQLSIGSTVSSSLNRTDQTGGTVLSEIASKVKSFTAGQIAYIQNHVLYGYDLEYGSSKQAPDGMVRITEAKFAGIVAAAIAMHKT